MAIGSRYNAGADNYLSMANQADQAAINEAKGMVSLFESGYNTMSKMKDRQRLDEARQAFETAWSSGNPEDVQRVIARFPEYGAQLQKALGVRDEQNRQQMGSLAIQLSGMLESGNIEGAQALLRNNPALFDKQGMFSAESVADAIGRAATGTDADSAKRLGMWKDWAQKLSLSMLNPKEIMNYGLSQQQMAQQLEMQRNSLAQQLQMANDRLGLGYAQLTSMQEHRQNMLNRPTPTMMNWEFLQSLSPEQQKQFLSLMPGGAGARGGSPGGMQKAQLADGRTVDIFPKVHKQGSTAFYQGMDADGSLINVPVDSVVSAPGSGHAANESMTAADLQTLANATDADLAPVTGALRGGGLGEMPIGADVYTGYTGKQGREIFSAAKRIQGRMQNQGIGAAREMGASGINTVAEAKMFFQSMPQLDFSNEQSLKASVTRIKDYVDKVNTKFNISPTGKSDASGLSDEELLSGL